MDRKDAEVAMRSSKAHRSRAAWAVALAMTAVSVCAQTAPAIHRIGYLGLDAGLQGFRFDAFKRRLRDLGYEDGRNLVIVTVWAEGHFERLPALAADLVAQNVEIIVTASPPAVRAAQKASSTIPIVCITHDPVGLGFVDSLAHPGGNITGIAFQDSNLSTKRLEALRSVLPKLDKVGVVWNRAGGGPDAVKAVVDAADKIGISTRVFEIIEPGDLPRAVADAKAWGAQGLLQLASPIISLNRRLFLDALARQRMPASCELRLYVEDGCLMTYSADLTGMFRDMADFTVRVLEGARPADLPLQQPRDFEFLINFTTAHALGLTIPASVRLQLTAGVR
jgi:putative ABC transport system substrate-binding protein